MPYFSIFLNCYVVYGGRMPTETKRSLTFGVGLKPDEPERLRALRTALELREKRTCTMADVFRAAIECLENHLKQSS